MLEARGHAHTRRGVLLLLTAVVTAIAADSTVTGKKKTLFADAGKVGLSVPTCVHDPGVGKLLDRWGHSGFLKFDRGAEVAADGWSVLVTHLIGEKIYMLGCVKKSALI